ncbi:hypothetical protein N5C93_01970 [Pseudomonas nitroreducens]|uniref:BPSL0761 family protein n=1 Tax=Pseudomonas nitroreducens TaxID=46680 RepID=UPI002449364E|nr:BPSL0761 family protein [Pseudomonas nitroreducens]EKV4131629.1 hypothetical protein [Pseudomonas aeruginosa]EKW1535922.1 hypothetical protein [Pseudomonas aeruginosa]ELQ7978539.1 hypothetical protein [Pseudomonas aeruginosa]ELV3002738.1 hypothetical protein [Pseudomonas aeruginosa]MDH1071591.1 hypothetical protein [Pseudomonas nitroreducens]
MTMPLERTSSLLEARSFLNSLRSNSEVSEEVKRQAERLLRHYPSAREVMQLAAKEDYIRQVASSVLPPLLLTISADDSGRLAQLVNEDGLIRT